MKQVPVPPMDRLERKAKDDVKFVKQVPFYLRERLKRKRKSTLENYSELSKNSKDCNVTFIKKVPLHPHEWKKGIEKRDQKVHIVNEIAAAKTKTY